MKHELEFQDEEARPRKGDREPVPPRRVTLPGMFGKPLSLLDVDSGGRGRGALTSGEFRGRGRHARQR
jgi:hypothetical protein